MNRKHRKALKATIVALLLCSGPVIYLAYLYQKNVVLDVSDFGVVPEFSLIFDNNPKGMTHYDTEHHITVVAMAKDRCTSDCPQFTDMMRKIRQGYLSELAGDSGNENTPLGVRFIIQAESYRAEIPEGWDLADMTDQSPYLLPKVKADATLPAFVLIDDASFYRGFVSLSDPYGLAKISKELNRMVSNQYLYYYVTRQTLMWEKAKGRKSSDDDNQTH